MFAKVKDNRDPSRMGRILSEDDRWFWPLAVTENEIDIPEPGDVVRVVDEFYLAGMDHLP